LFETLGGLETIKTVGGEGRMRHRWETAVGQAAVAGVKARFLSQLALNASWSARLWWAPAISRSEP
jgi:ATP-binding cassette subfamily C protein LapB